MKTVTRCCDRCGQCIVGQGSIIELMAGELRRRWPEELDWCPDCSHSFEDWMKSGSQTNHDGLGGAIADTAVASMELAGAIA